MSYLQKKKHSEAPSSSARASSLRLASSQVSPRQRLKFPANSITFALPQGKQVKQQSQPVYPWSAHAPPFGQSPSPFFRYAHALSTSATAAGELFLFGGFIQRSSMSLTNDLYVFSTRDFSTTLWKTSGDVPSPRAGHQVVLTTTNLLIWGGRTDFRDRNAQNSSDDSFYLLNLGTSDLFHVKTRSS